MQKWRQGFTSSQQTVKTEKHALADYIKVNQEYALMQVKNWKLLNVQETKYEYQNNIIKIQIECWQR